MNSVKNLKAIFASPGASSLDGYHSAISPGAIRALINEIEARRNQKALTEDAYAMLRIMKTWIGSSRAASSMDGKKLWDRIDLIEAGQSAVIPVVGEDEEDLCLARSEAETEIRKKFDAYNDLRACVDPMSKMLQESRHKIDYVCTPTRVEQLLKDMDAMRARILELTDKSLR